MKADTGKEITSLKVDGGASANDLLMQMQADFSDITVLRSSNAEATATGAAYLAGLATGFWADRDELISLAPDVREFTPEIDKDKRASILDGWRRAVRACREFSKTEE